MKIIFLDIDGVLNVIPTEFDKFGGIFHHDFVQNLKRIIDTTGAKIVISSSWRHSSLENMIKMWKYRNLPGEVIDITPDCAKVVEDENNEFLFYDQVQRGHEIQQWLDNHPGVDNYVILDDDDDMLESQLDHFIRTANNKSHKDCIDIGYGLTEQCTDNAISILNRT